MPRHFGTFRALFTGLGLLGGLRNPVSEELLNAWAAS